MTILHFTFFQPPPLRAEYFSCVRPYTCVKNGTFSLISQMFSVNCILSKRGSEIFNLREAEIFIIRFNWANTNLSAPGQKRQRRSLSLTNNLFTNARTRPESPLLCLIYQSKLKQEIVYIKKKIRLVIIYFLPLFDINKITVSFFFFFDFLGQIRGSCIVPVSAPPHYCIRA